MINFIFGILSMIVVAFLFGKIRGFIFKKVKPTLYDELSRKLKRPAREIPELKKLFDEENKPLNCSIGNVYHKNGGEVFQWKKFKKSFDLGSGGEWAKSIKEIIDLRKFVIYMTIIASIFAYGYFKGKSNTPIKVDLDYAKEFRMKLNGHYLVKPKNTQNLKIVDKEGNLVKDIKAKDFPLLAKKLKPIGFILEPIGIAGLGAGGVDRGFEGGAGVSFIKYWKWRLDAFLTTKGIYLGTSYQITDNSGLGIGAGKGFKGDNRIILYYKWRF